jgi:hypothetical protein
MAIAWTAGKGANAMSNRISSGRLSGDDLPIALFPATFLVHVAGRLTGMRWLAALGAGLMPVTAVASVATGVLALRRSRRLGTGSHRDPWESIDAPQLRAESSTEEVLDAGVEYTFPASDPVSVQSAYDEAGKREERNRGK